MKNTGICRLCNGPRELINSHIIPSSILKLIRDKKLKNRFYELFNKQRNIIQDGPKEFLLCGKCDGHLGKNEKYFKEALHLNRHNVEKLQYESWLIIKNLDYKKIKLFFLSLLWRASISSKPEFEKVCIGDNEEIIREMILNENPGHSSEFSISAIVPLINGKYHEGWATNFFDLKYEQTDLYSIVIGGVLYTIAMDNKNIFSTKEIMLNESGDWMIALGDAWKIQCLRDTIKDNFAK